MGGMTALWMQVGVAALGAQAAGRSVEGAVVEAPSPGFGWALLQMVVALVVVCVLAAVLLRWARRFLVGPRPHPGLVRVLDRAPLSPRQSVWVVEACGRYFVVGASDSGLSRLAELDRAEVEERLRAAEAGGAEQGRRRFSLFGGGRPRPDGGGR